MLSTNELDGLVQECLALPTIYTAAIVISGGWGCLLSICYMTLYRISSPTSITIAVRRSAECRVYLGSVSLECNIHHHRGKGREQSVAC
jgi:hypothetical protein